MRPFSVHPLSCFVENTPVLNYSKSQPGSLAYRIALVCGTLPLVFGVLIMCLWVPFQVDWLALMGLFTILAGTVLVMVGFAALFVARLVASREEGCDPKLVRKKVLLGAALLFVNFPVAAGFVWCANLMTQSGIEVVVYNSSGEILSDVHCTGWNGSVEISDIAPGEHGRGVVHLNNPGGFNLEAQARTFSVDHGFQHYATSNTSGTWILIVGPQGAVASHAEFGR